LHTAIDDLESFAWVGLWAALHQMTEKSIEEKLWLAALSCDDISRVADKKLAIMLNRFNAEDLSEGLPPLLPLLKDWFSLAKVAQDQLDELIWEKMAPTSDDEVIQKAVPEFKDLCHDYYVQYLQKTVEFLST
jgi:hypothetical protein